MTKSTTPRKAKWRQPESHLFVENINREHIQGIIHFLRRFNESPSQESLDIAVNKLSDTFILSANTSFPCRPIPCFKANNRNKPWFGRHCKHARKVYNRAKKKYNTHRSQDNRTAMQRASKIYKNTLNNYINKHIKANESKLRNVHRKCPKEYWKFLNSLKNTS